MRILTARPRATAALTAMAALAVLGLAACGSAGSSADTAAGAGEGTAGQAASAFPVTLENAFGSTEIESRPDAVASVAWGNHDVPIALGVVPVGMPEATFGDDDGDGVLPWTYDALKELGATGDSLPALFDETDSIDFEGVANTAPEVILAAYSGLTKQDYATLTEIAPTVSYPDVAWGTSWRDMATINGAALGRREQAEARVAEVDRQIDQALAERPRIAGKTVAYTWIDPADTSSIWVYTPIDARVQLVGDLGMATAQGVVDLAGDGKEFGIQLAAENVDAIADADILVTYGDGSTLSKLRADPLIGKLPAIERGSVVILSDNTPLAAATSGPTILSIPWALEDYLDLFAEAATKVP